MRKIRFAFVVLLLAMVVLCYSGNLVKAPAEGEGQSQSRAGLSIEIPIPADTTQVATIVGILTRPGYSTLKRDFRMANGLATAVFPNIAAGRWHLQVSAYDASRSKRYSGETDADIRGGATTPVSLTLSPSTGSLAVSVKWGNPAESNRALEFDGESGYVEVLDSPSLTNLDSAITLEAWVKPGDTRFYNYLVCKGFSDLEYSMELIESALHPAFHGKDLNLDVSGASEYWGRIVLEKSLSVGVWTHLAVAYQDGEGLSVYVNGKLALHSKSAGSLSHIAGNLRMGVLLNDTYQLFFKGTLDEVRVWNVARTADQIAANMRWELSGNEPGLVGYWNFNDLTTTSMIRDGSPYGNNGMLRGGVHFTADTPF